MHKFRVGQTVDFLPSRQSSAARGSYSVIRLLPEEQQGPHYRIKSKQELHERIAHECELTVTGR